MAFETKTLLSEMIRINAGDPRISSSSLPFSARSMPRNSSGMWLDSRL